MFDDDASHLSAADEPYSLALAALKRELQERDDLLALMTHELRNPLHSILLQLEVARIGVQTGDQSMAVAKLNKLRASLLRYSNRATVLLDLIARKDGYPVQKQPIDLHHLLSELVERLKLEASFHRIELRHVTPAGPVLAEVDAVVLEQIVENLLLNAFKHSGGTEVVLSLGRDAALGGIEIEIRDNGRGISVEDQTRIFSKHEVGSGNGRLSGTGLGLWIVQRLSAALGASISLHSLQGAGCRFTLILPSPSSPPQ